MELTAALESLIAQEGVSLFAVADTAGFQHALPDWHPKHLVPMAKRALVFGWPFVGPKPTRRTFQTKHTGRRMSQCWAK